LANKQLAYINKQMLKWARSETPFDSIYDVALRIQQFTYEKILAWENGDELPSIAEAKKLANLYDVPFACLFYTKIPDKKPKPYTDRRTMINNNYGKISYELWKEIRRIISNREIAVEAAPEFISKFEKLPQVQPGDDVKTVATKIRTFLNFSTPFKYKSKYNDSAFNYFRSIFERKGIMVAQISGVSVSEIKGLSFYYNAMPIIATNTTDWERAKVFTLFHEMVHLLRRSSSLCLIDFDERNDSEEKLCDKIAAEALLPELQFREIASSIKKEYKSWENECLIKIADKFAVSTTVVLRRLYELKIIEYDYYVKRYAELANDFAVKRALLEKSRKMSVPIKYHYKYLNQQGYLFPKTMLAAYATGNISYGEMCRSLNIDSSHINNVEQVVMFK